MNLEQRQCRAKAPALDQAAIATLLPHVTGWTATDGGLARTFTLPDYRATIAFVNAVAAVAEHEDHHPEMTVGYAACRVTWTTHSAGGALSDNDFICAAKVNALYPQQETA